VTEQTRERIAAPPQDAASHRAALAHVARGDLAGARTIWQALLARTPGDPIARYQIGLTWHDAGDLRRAASWYRQQVEAFPDSFGAWHNLGLCLLALGEFLEAVAASRAAIALERGHYAAQLNLGAALDASGDIAAAVDAYREAHHLQPAEVEPLERAAAALGRLAEVPEAIELLGQAIALAPARASLWWARAAHRSSLGEHRLALEDMRRARDLAPDDSRGHSAILVELQYDTSLATPAEITAEARLWATRHAPPETTATTPVASRARRGTAFPLRIGYLSPRFGAGPLASFFLPVLESHDRRRVGIVLYAGFPHEEGVAAQMRSRCSAWRTLPPDDDAAAAMIAADRLDVLIDLAGHAPGGRLPVLARRPAPVQATWLDYSDTTGLSQIDYLVSDAVHTPPGEASHFTERLVLLPRCKFVYAPPAQAPAPGTSPGRGIAFGCFNRHAKISDDAVRLWARLLERVAGSRLVLRAAAYRGSGTVAHVRERWAGLGLPLDRVEFLPYAPLAEALATYNAIDVALDPFPYNGGVTTCDALAMGVPVVALLGTRVIGRQSAALLHAAGKPDWIGATANDYVEIAACLARSPALRARSSLSEGVRQSPLCRAREFTAVLERAFARMAELGRHAAGHNEPVLIEA
jgi:predicted O-linked N-acetylglucosamine transferase (SPINDLY family)